jgi:outer membrane protein assembly factor BamB
MRPAWKAVLLVGAFAGNSAPVCPNGDETRPPRFKIDHDARRVVGKNGKSGWSTRLGGLPGLVRPPHLVWDARRVYVSQKDGVTALDAGTGKVLWHSKGPNCRLLLSGDLLLAADGRLVLARKAASGAEAFKARLPVRSKVTPDLVAAALRGEVPWYVVEGLEAVSFNPEPIAEVAGLFLVQAGRMSPETGAAFLLDRTGRVRHRLDRQVLAGIRQGGDRVLLTSRGVVRLSPQDKILWSVPFGQNEAMEDWFLCGGLKQLPGGDLLAFRYSPIDDSGVDLIRFTPSSGRVVWRAGCSGLGVEEIESEYDHEAAVVVKGDTVRVSSKADEGRFVEVLDLRTGKQLKRTVSKP